MFFSGAAFPFLSPLLCAPPNLPQPPLAGLPCPESACLVHAPVWLWVVAVGWDILMPSRRSALSSPPAQFSLLCLKMSTSYLARIFPDLENSIKQLSNT